MTNFEIIQTLVKNQDVRISDHGYDELANDNLTAREVITGITDALLLEDYPNYNKGASILVLQKAANGEIIHVVWGIPKGHEKPAVLITTYKPNPKHWNNSFTERLK